MVMVMTMEMPTMMATVWVKIFSAFSWSPWPRAKAHRVEVPMDRRMATPERKLIKGREIFTPARASSPTPLEIKIPSTMV